MRRRTDGTLPTQGRQPAGQAADAVFERELAAAVSRGELVVHYQPVLSLPSRRCTAVEALVRWVHPRHGLLLPDAFIPVAERTGAIAAIGSFVLRRSCADAATWRDTHPGSPLALHVNISALQLHDDRLGADVSACLAEFDVPPNQLVLEVTQATAASSPATIGRLGELAALGVVIAIDDVGTDSSALTTLASVPVQIVKIDRSIVAGSTENCLDRAVTAEVVTRAAAMGLRTIAAGVERADQQEYLESIGAGAAQGYLYQRPAPADEFGAWLDQHLSGLPTLVPDEAVILAFAPRTGR
ncbi:EAL domain-containing protein [Pengzhenrongella sicca]|uniref:EAL domain-containing protein n=1 Tax=Pengzhenrongella sicca TaxID=2819238 RepID=A0A8A4ZDV3_9MICO|nr:EAL domain-containing protein [Pengzhenrongella sicca]QTE27888.1 EAL domain-containing protein [Pengzhenrongella sicca]